MPKRDAFGRLPDENPLAGLGALSDGSPSQPVVAPDEGWSVAEPVKQARPAPRAESAPKARPATSASSAQPKQSPGVDQALAEVMRQAEAFSGVKVAQSVRVVSRVVKLVVFLIVIGIIAGVGGTVINAGKTIRDTVGDLPSPSKIAEDASPPPSVPEKAEAPPRGLSSSSLLARRNFDRVIKRLSTSGLGRLESLTIRPEMISSRLLTKGGSLRTVWIRAGDQKLDSQGTIGPGFSPDTVRFSKIDTGAPARLARSAAGRARRPVSQVSYITMSSSQGEVVWGAYLEGGRIYQANARGRITRRIS